VRRLYFGIFGVTILTAIACGARTGLEVPSYAVPEAGPDVFDAPPDVFDAPPDVVDAPPDVPVVIDECADAGTQYIYLITQENELFSFYPPDGTLNDIGPINCPSGSTPFSMGVNRAGIAYSVFSDGNLFTFSTAHPDQCQATPYVPTKIGNGNTFGMGFSADVADGGESLYIASDDPQTGPIKPEILGTIDVNTFTLSAIDPFSQIIGSAELTGTGDGRLYGFGVDQSSAGGTTYHLIQIDKTDASLISELPLSLPSGGARINAWAFAFFGGNFYFFTSPTLGQTMISIYQPQPGDTSATATQLLIANDTIVGAGVSTCAPQQ
jgi:hypothetical protein